MFTLSLAADSPGGWCKIWEIETELYDFEKEITTKNDGKVQELVWLVEAERKLRANYILSNGVWILKSYQADL